MSVWSRALDIAVALGVGFMLVALSLGAAGCAHAVVAIAARPNLVFARELSFNGQRCRASLPLVVRSDAGPEVEAAVARAADAWSSVLGVPVAIGGGADADVVLEISPHPTDRPLALAQCERRCENGELRQVIRFFNLAPEYLDRVAVHELGHAIGVEGDGDEFGHNIRKESVMYKHTLLKTPQEILPSDIAAFRKTWGLE